MSGRQDCGTSYRLLLAFELSFDQQTLGLALPKISGAGDCVRVASDEEPASLLILEGPDRV